MNAQATELTTVKEIITTVGEFLKVAKSATDRVCNGPSPLCQSM